MCFDHLKYFLIRFYILVRLLYSHKPRSRHFLIYSLFHHAHTHIRRRAGHQQGPIQVAGRRDGLDLRRVGWLLMRDRTGKPTPPPLPFTTTTIIQYSHLCVSRPLSAQGRSSSSRAFVCRRTTTTTAVTCDTLSADVAQRKQPHTHTIRCIRSN